MCRTGTRIGLDRQRASGQTKIARRAALVKFQKGTSKRDSKGGLNEKLTTEVTEVTEKRVWVFLSVVSVSSVVNLFFAARKEVSD
jgi:hypothetical protein